MPPLTDEQLLKYYERDDFDSADLDPDEKVRLDKLTRGAQPGSVAPPPAKKVGWLDDPTPSLSTVGKPGEFTTEFFGGAIDQGKSVLRGFRDVGSAALDVGRNLLDMGSPSDPETGAHAVSPHASTVTGFLEGAKQGAKNLVSPSHWRDNLEAFTGVHTQGDENPARKAGRSFTNTAMIAAPMAGPGPGAVAKASSGAGGIEDAIRAALEDVRTGGPAGPEAGILKTAKGVSSPRLVPKDVAPGPEPLEASFPVRRSPEEIRKINDAMAEIRRRHPEQFPETTEESTRGTVPTETEPQAAPVAAEPSPESPVSPTEQPYEPTLEDLRGWMGAEDAARSPQVRDLGREIGMKLGPDDVRNLTGGGPSHTPQRARIAGLDERFQQLIDDPRGEVGPDINDEGLTVGSFRSRIRNLDKLGNPAADPLSARVADGLIEEALAKAGSRGPDSSLQPKPGSRPGVEPGFDKISGRLLNRVARGEIKNPERMKALQAVVDALSDETGAIRLDDHMIDDILAAVKEKIRSGNVAQMDQFVDGMIRHTQTDNYQLRHPPGPDHVTLPMGERPASPHGPLVDNLIKFAQEENGSINIKDVGKFLNELRMSSMLSGLALPKSILGNVGAITTASLERGSTHPIREALNLPENARVAKSAWQGHANPAGVGGTSGVNLPGRTMGMFDEVTTQALQRAGLSLDDAQRLLLTRPNPLGKSRMQDFVNSTPGKFIVPFTKTPFNQLIEGFSGENWNSPGRAALSTATAGAGGVLGSNTKDPKILGLAAALAGPRGVPFLLGAAMGGAGTNAAAGISPIPEWGIPSKPSDLLRMTGLPPAAVSAYGGSSKKRSASRNGRTNKRGSR